MPTYDYHCDKCNKTMEIFHNMFDESQQKCPTCNSEIYKIYITPPYGFIDEPRTVGGLADKNASKYSNDQKEEIRLKTRSRPPKKQSTEKPLYDKYRTKTNKEVLKMTPEQRKKYILTGN